MLEGSTAVLEQKDKDQGIVYPMWPRLTSRIYLYLYAKTTGSPGRKFTDKGSDVDMTGMKSEMSFLQLKLP